MAVIEQIQLFQLIISILKTCNSINKQMHTRKSIAIIYEYIYISDTIEVLRGFMFRNIINLFQLELYIVLFLSIREVPDQTFSKEAKKNTNKNPQEKHRGPKIAYLEYYKY